MLMTTLNSPFFHFLAFTAPHFPLHALPEDIAQYEGTYNRDWEKIRKKRYRNLVQSGIISSKLSPVERNLGPPYDFPEALKVLGEGEINRPLAWRDLTPDQKEFQAGKMALHAAMITRMDAEIGRVVQQLKEMGALENTLILFLSDNGASAEIMVRDDGHDPMASMGSAATYLCLGPGGSTNSNTPFRRHKTWVHEGGISTPLIAHWPKGISSLGKLRHQPGHVVDLVPTFLEIAGVSQNMKQQDQLVPEAPGNSLLSVLTANKELDRPYIWWYHEGNRALRSGDWKIVSAAKEFSVRRGVFTLKHGDWELYNLATDRTEINDLSSTHQEQLKSMVTLWDSVSHRIVADSRPEPIKKNWHSDFVEVRIASSADGHIQKALFLGSKEEAPQPLLVSLHTWSNDYLQADTLSIMARKHGWNYIHPDFRGPNRTINACCSDLALSDIDDAIDYAIANGHVDPEKIFVAGASGGGYASLAVYMKSRHRINRISAWVPISDLEAWYRQSKIRKNKYAGDILNCTGSGATLDSESARARSPIHWPVHERENATGYLCRCL